MRPSTSRISPTRDSPGQTRDAIVAGIDFGQRDAARCDLGVGVAAGAGHRQRPLDERARPDAGARRAEKCASATLPSIASWRRIAAATDAGSIDGERRLHRGLRDSRAAALPLRVHVVEPRAGAEVQRSARRGRPSSCARSQWRDAFSATGPLMPKCVQSSAPASRTATAPSTQTASSASCATPESSRCTRVRRREQQRHQRRRRSARSCGRAAARSRSRRRRCRSSAATVRRSRARRAARRQIAVASVTTRNPDCRLRGVRRREHARGPPQGSAPTPPASRAAARQARRARGSCPETACRRPPRAARRRSRGRTRRCRRPETRAGRGGRSTRGPPQKSRSVTEAFVTLQRLPPLTRILAPGARAPSSSDDRRERVEAAGENRGGEAGGAGADDRDVARWARHAAVGRGGRRAACYRATFLGPLQDPLSIDMPRLSGG